MKRHLTNGLGYTQCGLSDDSVGTTNVAKKTTCERCKKSKAYKSLNL